MVKNKAIDLNKKNGEKTNKNCDFLWMIVMDNQRHSFIISNGLIFLETRNGIHLDIC